MNNKAIMTTSANPFHYGHLDIYKKAKRVFDDVTVGNKLLIDDGKIISSLK